MDRRDRRLTDQGAGAQAAAARPRRRRCSPSAATPTPGSSTSAPPPASPRASSTGTSRTRKPSSPSSSATMRLRLRRAQARGHRSRRRPADPHPPGHRGVACGSWPSTAPSSRCSTSSAATPTLAEVLREGSDVYAADVVRLISEAQAARLTVADGRPAAATPSACSAPSRRSATPCATAASTSTSTSSPGSSATGWSAASPPTVGLTALTLPARTRIRPAPGHSQIGCPAGSDDEHPGALVGARAAPRRVVGADGDPPGHHGDPGVPLALFVFWLPVHVVWDVPYWWFLLTYLALGLVLLIRPVQARLLAMIAGARRPTADERALLDTAMAVGAAGQPPAARPLHRRRAAERRPQRLRLRRPPRRRHQLRPRHAAARRAGRRARPRAEPPPRAAHRRADDQPLAQPARCCCLPASGSGCRTSPPRRPTRSPASRPPHRLGRLLAGVLRCRWCSSPCYGADAFGNVVAHRSEFQADRRVVGWATAGRWPTPCGG